jgi:hypothetical protein
VDVTLVHGDITEHLDWLETKNASIVLRRKLLTKCLEINPFLWKNSVNLQPKWENPPIPKLKWSGEDATDSLISKLMKLSKTSVLATISHSDTKQEHLVDEILLITTKITSIIIFHIDSEDYELR